MQLIKREIMSRNEEVWSMKKKWKALWADNRSYQKRLLLSGAAMLTFCFTFLFFGPLEMVAFSADSLVFSWTDVVGVLGVAAVAAWVAGALLLALLRGKIFNYTLSVLFAVNVAGWLQAGLLNGNLGTLTGDPVPWAGMTGAMAGNLCLWVFVLLAVLFVMYLHREFWKKLVCFVSAVLVVMQMVPAVGIFAGAYGTAANKADNFFSQQGMYSFSENDNIFVFVLDRLDYSYIQKALKQEPDMLDFLDGFTGYTNAISAFARTRPALVHLLTGYEDTANRVPTKEFYQQAWETGDRNVLQELREQDYSIRLYTKLNYLFSSPETAATYVDNLGHDKGDLQGLDVLKKLWQLSAYRYAPTVAKPFFWADTNYYNGGAYNRNTYEYNDVRYAQGLAKGEATETQGSFKLFHFFGPHAPYTMNADGSLAQGETTVTDQTRGSFANLERIFNRMKELGIYEDATIIITGDHGDPISDRKPIQRETRIGLFYKPSGSAGTPYVTTHAPVSTENIPATLVKALGADHSSYGLALDEVAEDADIVRYTYKSVIGENTGREVGLYTYTVTGDASDFDNWEIVDYVDVDYSFY